MWPGCGPRDRLTSKTSGALSDVIEREGSRYSSSGFDRAAALKSAADKSFHSKEFQGECEHRTIGAQ